jgi:dethiobiotin synthetase
MRAMRTRFLFVTGTDTGVGKTLVTALLTREFCRRGLGVVALKPLASGGREDARALWEAADRRLSLDEVNPWHFRAPVAPLLAARRAGRRVTRREVLAHLGAVSRGFDLVLVEGAGGLLSPLGEDFDSRDLIRALTATPVLVAANRLGMVNQVLLTLAALPAAVARRTHLVVSEPARSDPATRTNLALLRELLPGQGIHRLPWLGESVDPARAAKRASIRRMLSGLSQALGV